MLNSNQPAWNSARCGVRRNCSPAESESASVGSTGTRLIRSRFGSTISPATFWNQTSRRSYTNVSRSPLPPSFVSVSSDAMKPQSGPRTSITS